MRKSALTRQIEDLKGRYSDQIETNANAKIRDFNSLYPKPSAEDLINSRYLQSLKDILPDSATINYSGLRWNHCSHEYCLDIKIFFPPDDLQDDHALTRETAIAGVQSEAAKKRLLLEKWHTKALESSIQNQPIPTFDPTL